MSALATNLMHFARILRRAGLPIGPEKGAAALEALQVIDISRREDMFHALHAVFVERHTQTDLFKRAFDSFWLSRGDSSLANADVPMTAAHIDIGVDQGSTLNANEDQPVSARWSAAESLREKDFAGMTAPETVDARRLITSLRLPVTEITTRRFKAGASHGAIDMRATLRTMIRSSGLINLQYKQRVKRQPALVVLCDISGSMEPYARMMLYFLHALTNDRDRVHTFLFGTRLTNVTRQLSHRDPDEAITQVARSALDWSGGTRIGEAIATFNRLWSRRVLAQGAVVLLITDGLDRDAGTGLGEEMQRLRRSCRHLIWLNPLLRYAAFKPKSAGIRAMLPHVDDFRPVHNLDSLAALITALSAPARRKVA